VPLLQAFKSSERSKKSSANYSRHFSLNRLIGKLQSSQILFPGAPYHGPCATKADLGNERKCHLADNVRKPAVRSTFWPAASMISLRAATPIARPPSPITIIVAIAQHIDRLFDPRRAVPGMSCQSSVSTVDE
jgi:hypothetical protein